MTAVSSPAVLVVVVHHAGKERTRRALDSLESQTYRNLRITLVDHSEQPDERIDLAEGSRVRLLRPGENGGFASGLNAALAADDAPVVATLNPDADAGPTWIARWEALLEESPLHGMVAGRVESARRPGRLDSAGLSVSRGGLGILRGHGRAVTISRERLDALPLLGPAGSAAMYRRKALEAIGGFPEAYFLYYEDLEVAWRMRVRGFTCGWEDEPLVHHEHVSGAGSDKTRWLRRSRRLFRARNFDAALRARTRTSARFEDALSRIRPGASDVDIESASGPSVDSFEECGDPLPTDMEPWLVPTRHALREMIRGRR